MGRTAGWSRALDGGGTEKPLRRRGGGVSPYQSPQHKTKKPRSRSTTMFLCQTASRGWLPARRPTAPALGEAPTSQRRRPRGSWAARPPPAPHVGRSQSPEGKSGRNREPTGGLPSGRGRPGRPHGGAGAGAWRPCQEAAGPSSPSRPSPRCLFSAYLLFPGARPGRSRRGVPSASFAGTSVLLYTLSGLLCFLRNLFCSRSGKKHPMAEDVCSGKSS